MATRKIVPRADNEGGLGTALKRWASAFINALTANTAAISTDGPTGASAVNTLYANNLIKAYVTFNGNAGITILEQFNITSVTRTSAGIYVVTMATAMAGTNYAVVVGYDGKLTGSLARFNIVYINNSSTFTIALSEKTDTANVDDEHVRVIVVGKQ